MKSVRNEMVWVVLSVFFSWYGLSSSWAASAGYSEYYIPGDEAIMHAILDEIGDGDQADPNADMQTVITVTVWADNSTVYYDHWEDGYDFDPDDPSTADETYVLASGGDRQIFTGNNVLTDPRGTATYYDGRDRIYVAGGAATVSRSSWTVSAGTSLAVAWAVYPVRLHLPTTCMLPFGENLADTGGANLQDFERVYGLIQATKDGTVVTVDFDGDGIPDMLDHDRDGANDGTTIELDAGEVYRLDRASSTAIATLVFSTAGSPGAGMMETITRFSLGTAAPRSK